VNVSAREFKLFLIFLILSSMTWGSLATIVVLKVLS
jgi:hypothetical protein